MNATLFRWLMAALLCAWWFAASAQPADGVDRSRDNLMVVLREMFNAPVLRTETLQFVGKLRALLPDGKEIELEQAHYLYLGDMHLRFVFDGPVSMRNATPQDLASLNLTPEEALRVAVANIRRVYGAPQAKPFIQGLRQVEGKSPDLNSSYFLDKTFWDEQLKQHPEGLVAAVPKRGGLAFCALSDKPQVETLRKSVAYLHSSSGRLRVSSGLYLYKDGKWTVFQDPVKQPER